MYRIGVLVRTASLVVRFRPAHGNLDNNVPSDVFNHYIPSPISRQGPVLAYLEITTGPLNREEERMEAE